MSSAIPSPGGPTLHESLEALQSSAHLGVVTADLEHVIDANDAFLRMIGYTRAEMEAGIIDWRAMTTPECLRLDEIALQQMRDYGACVPFEKEYILRDGTRLPILIGGIRVKANPLVWVSYVIDLTTRRRAEDAERAQRALQARQEVINQLAHEINNPLAAVTLIVGALQMKEASRGDEEAVRMLHELEQMLERIAALTRAVLAVGSDG